MYISRLEKVYMTVLYPILWNWEAVVTAAATAKISNPGFAPKNMSVRRCLHLVIPLPSLLRTLHLS